MQAHEVAAIASVEKSALPDIEVEETQERALREAFEPATLSDARIL